MTAAKLLVNCLEAEGVEYIFGIPGEENIDFMDALVDSPIKFIVVRHEQAASLMASVYGRYSGKAGVCLATLGPGAINLILGAAAAFQDYAPLVALTGQRGVSSLFQESHQVLDLVKLFEPVTKWCCEIDIAEEIPGYVRKAFKIATADKFGSTMLVLPEDVAGTEITDGITPLIVRPHAPSAPDPAAVAAAVALLAAAKNPVLLAGSGIVRAKAYASLKNFVDRSGIAVFDLFASKGVLDNRHPAYVAPVGFMARDYANIALERADLILAVGYDFIEYFPKNFAGAQKKIINISATGYECDRDFNPDVDIPANISQSLDALADKLVTPINNYNQFADIHAKWIEELHKYDQQHFAGAIKPERMIADLRAAVGETDIVICDTGALKMWFARLYPVHHADQFLLSNGLATMSLAWPGAIGAKLARPEQNIIAVMGDGSFMMNSQEIETACRCGIPFVIFVWRDNSYGLIKWRQDLKFGRASYIDFGNPDFAKYADSFGIKYLLIDSSDKILPVLKAAIALNEVVLVECEVDYSDNVQIVKTLQGLKL